MKHSHAMEINNLQIHRKEHPASQEYLERIIAELRNDISKEEASTQKAIANCKAQINELYELFKVHKCWVE